MNKQKDRLVELLRTVDNMRLMRAGFSECADHLLANGVIVPPCKVGDKVYCVFEDDVIEDEIILIEATEISIYLSTCSERYMWLNGYLYSEMLDQKLFLTKEEAEAKLKEGVQG